MAAYDTPDLACASDASMSVKSRWRSVFEEPVEAAGEVALEAAVCFAPCFAFLEAPFDVGDRGGVCAFAGDEDHVECAVEFAVAARSRR